jgi:hypothetical protein
MTTYNIADEFHLDPNEHTASILMAVPTDNPLRKMADVVLLRGKTIKVAYRAWDNERGMLLFKYNTDIKFDKKEDAEKLFRKIVRWMSHVSSEACRGGISSAEINYIYDVLRQLGNARGAGRFLFDMIADK